MDLDGAGGGGLKIKTLPYTAEHVTHLESRYDVTRSPHIKIATHLGAEADVLPCLSSRCAF